MPRLVAGCFPRTQRYEDLLRDEDLGDAAERAFGREGLGIAVVTGVPDISDRRRDLFHLGRRFATLPDETRAQYEHPASTFSFGWSHGKEMLEAGRPDLAKGSFYANPCFDAPFADDAAAVATHPQLAHPNVWPDAEVAGFSSAFKTLGQAVVRVGVLVARQCDRYAEKVHGGGYERGKLERIASSSRCCKGRLLHYFPRGAAAVGSSDNNGAGGAAIGHVAGVTAANSAAPGDVRDSARDDPPATAGRSLERLPGDDDGVSSEVGAGLRGALVDPAEDGPRVDGDGIVGGGGEGGGGGGGGVVSAASDDDDGRSFSDWCGWHHDHGSLTGLVPAMFFDAEGGEVDNADPDCGLFIRSRQGKLVKATLPPGEPPSRCLLFQIGETTQVHSGGALQATPHAVRSTSRPGVSREAFAVFMQPEWGESMDVPRGTELRSTRSSHAANLLPRQAATITERLRPGMDYGAFTAATIGSFY